jgi:hypothetical protein
VDWFGIYRGFRKEKEKKRFEGIMIFTQKFFFLILFQNQQQKLISN